MPGGQEYLNAIMSFAPLVIIIVLFYFLLIRPQRKRDKAEREMRNSIPLGDPRQGGRADRNGRSPQGCQ